MLNINSIFHCYYTDTYEILIQYKCNLEINTDYQKLRNYISHSHIFLDVNKDESFENNFCYYVKNILSFFDYLQKEIYLEKCNEKLYNGTRA